MELQTIEPVLTEVSDDIKKLNKLSAQLAEKVDQLEKRISSFDEKLDQVKILPPPVDTSPIQNLVQEKMTAIENRIEAQPKNVIKKTQLLFFPEQDTKEYYLFFANKPMPYVIWFSIVYFLFCLGRIYLNNTAPANTPTGTISPLSPRSPG